VGNVGSARSTGRCKDNDVVLMHGDPVGNLDKELLPEWRYFCKTVLVTWHCEFGLLRHQYRLGSWWFVCRVVWLCCEIVTMQVCDVPWTWSRRIVHKLFIVLQAVGRFQASWRMLLIWAARMTHGNRWNSNVTNVDACVVFLSIRKLGIAHRWSFRSGTCSWKTVALYNDRCALVTLGLYQGRAFMRRIYENKSHITVPKRCIMKGVLQSAPTIE